tara:strand:+ start:457 stop:1560 length:1104 start_codon:yes stop_codon:yes gene_type:complete
MKMKNSQMKIAILKSGGQTVGLSDSELRAAYERLTGAPAPQAKPAPAPQAKPAPAPQAKPAPAATVKPLDASAQLMAAIQAMIPQAAPVVDEARLIDLIKEHAQQTVTVEVKAAGKIKAIEGAHKSLATLVTMLSTETHVYLVGPAGSGKTTLAAQSAEALGKDFYKQGSILAKHELVGFVDAAGTYHRTAFRDAFELGGVMLIDEIDNNSPEALVAINDALANGSFTFPDSTRSIKRHADFICIAAANTIGRGATRQYVGRMPLDAATLDRFIQLEVDYDLDIERGMALNEFKRFGGTEEHIALDWLTEVRDLREKLNDKGYKVVVSPRASMAGAKLLAKGMCPKQVRESVTFKHLSKDQRKQLGV